MFEKTDLNKIVSDPANSQYQHGNAFGIAGTAEPESKEYISVISILAYVEQNVKDSIGEYEIRIQIASAPEGIKLSNLQKQRLKNTLGEIFFSTVGKVVEQNVKKKKNKSEPIRIKTGGTPDNKRLSTEVIIEYRVCYNDSEPSGFLLDVKTKEKIVNKERDKYKLFIIREEAITHIFINGDVTDLRPSKIGYRILTLALKHRGNCGTAWNIAKHLYDIKEAEKFKDLREMAKVVKEQPKLNVAIEKFKTKTGNVEYYSNRVRRLINQLNKSFLNKLNTTLKANDMDEYEINPPIRYCLIENT